MHMRYIAAIAALWAVPAAAQVSNPPTQVSAPDLSGYATKADMDAAAQAAQTALTTAQARATPAQIDAAIAGTVRQVNGLSPNASGVVTVPVPTAGTTVPPSVADSGMIGTMTTQYALANHTHASKARKLRASSDAAGIYVWTFSTPFTTGVTPICTVTAETATGVTDVINAQIEGVPTATAANIRINRTNRSTVALLGLTILSVPATPGVTPFHAICLEP